MLPWFVFEHTHFTFVYCGHIIKDNGPIVTQSYISDYLAKVRNKAFKKCMYYKKFEKKNKTIIILRKMLFNNITVDS